MDKVDLIIFKQAYIAQAKRCFCCGQPCIFNPNGFKMIDKNFYCQSCQDDELRDVEELLNRETHPTIN
ncbi:hypothetical protein A2331_01920 [Candidatus Falkowbacteria bacterium RIFOXYB2_FULL_34_18]|uniref:Uncharacterized protein n=1 Tax=Candidatus Falkowbacteria bacterium RIFOXYD2_FULL_34_120 TaxID=1798007 RepID=A0A1F5TQF2_9BACT|nr:MAG: hypothetical protein A2331_01920 [Candidatus Falkowbacteria bacterium RIFOXYB2_FULL_34_18]OGF29442.1 MAG: hypothetical protein A2500_00985 [Candidatus Falkowbacteria bacterium RIFOXYC12_FULL_34_55]OGF36755.1 MAG: hypothetical protein A2466_03295 [Candidatus Falkowbacteria bacterium RIFOXYC2_FULL_34_220]OGF38968.1 MAG: hypothetical protein A2515_05410 [Candidatus Falkowbacteria bacterium RIFOXYD12_FULL_34_57]OGF41160.1 MAG: hypothetical protein A2531_01410 [Candidatus Falkowbacteria bact